MPTHKIAIVKGDGIGVDVVNEGMKVLDALAPRYGITWDYTEFPWSSDYYFEHGEMMPSTALKTLEQFNAVFLGCLLYTSPSPRDGLLSRMPSSA